MGQQLLIIRELRTAGVWQEVLGTIQPIKLGKLLQSEKEQEPVPCFGGGWEDIRTGFWR